MNGGFFYLDRLYRRKEKFGNKVVSFFFNILKFMLFIGYLVRDFWWVGRIFRFNIKESV